MFTRKDSHKKKRLGEKWRKPKGLHNKMRLQKRGHKPIVKSGYASSVETRGKVKGLEVVNVKRLADLESIDPKTQSVIISSTVSMKNRILMLEECKKKNISVNNHKLEKAESLKKQFEEKKSAKESREKKKAEKAKKAKSEEKAKSEAKEKAKSEEKDAAKSEEKAKSEDKAEPDKAKKEKDKVLIKKQ